jgi:hypothetical protein
MLCPICEMFINLCESCWMMFMFVCYGTLLSSSFSRVADPDPHGCSLIRVAGSGTGVKLYFLLILKKIHLTFVKMIF